MKRRSIWLMALLIVSACGGRTGLIESLGQPSASGGSSNGGRGGSAPAKGGSAPIIGGTFGESGTFGSGGTFGVAGTGGMPAECTLPLADCAAPSELACQGQRKPCAGALLESYQLDADHGVVVADVATSRDRRVAVAGSFHGTLKVGDTVLESPPHGEQPFPTATFVASFDSNGKPEWAYMYSSNTEYEATALRFAPNGDIVFQAATYYDREPAAVVGRLSASGALLWSTQWGRAGHITTGRIGIDNDGRIWLGGTFRSTFDFPEAPALETKEQSSGYLLELTGDGVPLRAFNITPPAWFYSEETGIAVDDEDNVLVVGIGRLPDKVRLDVAGAFLEKFSPNGDLLYARSFPGDLFVSGVAVDRMMRPTVFGQFNNSFTNEGATFTAPSLGQDMWLAQFSRDGALTWQQAFPSNVTVTAGTTDPFDNIIVAGTGALEVDGQPVRSQRDGEPGSEQLTVLLKLRPDGRRIWVKPLSGNIVVTGIATDNDAFIWLGTQFRAQAWVDDTKLSTNDIAGLLLKLSP